MPKNQNKRENRPKRVEGLAASYLLIAAFFAGCAFAGMASAAPPPGTSTAPYTVSYSGKLTNSAGAPVVTSQNIRFSLWSDSDSDAGDYLVTGVINPAAGGYAGWQETHAVTPDSNGLFHVQLGSIATLPNFTSATQVFLEVDVKSVGAPDTSYEVLDPDGNTANLTDRHTLNSSAFAVNADTVDNADTGVGPGNIPVLDGAGLLPVSTIPGGTDADSFILDFDDTVAAPGSITLQFGSTLARFLEYDTGAGWFNFSDDLNVTGDLTVTGGLLAAGNVDFSSSAEFHMREVADEAAAACTTVGELVLDTAENRIYVCTAAGSPGTWAASDMQTYSQSIVYEPVYTDAVIQPDGTDNQGTLESFYADTDGSPGNANINHYKWGTTRATLQDMDLILRVVLPEGFVSFQATPLTLAYRTDTANAADNRLDILVEDTAGVAVPLTGASSLVSASWAAASVTFGGSPTFTAGDSITIKIKLSGTNIGAAYAGQLSLNYIGR